MVLNMFVVMDRLTIQKNHKFYEFDRLCNIPMGWRGSPKIKVEDEKLDGGNAPKVGDVREGIVMPMFSNDHPILFILPQI